MLVATVTEALPFLGIAFSGLVVLVAATWAAVVRSRRAGAIGVVVVWVAWTAIALASLFAVFVIGSIGVGSITCPPDIPECPV